MQLVNDTLFPAAAGPRLIRPAISTGRDHLARAVHVLRLKARSRVRHLKAIWEDEAISSPRPGIGGLQLVPAACERVHRVSGAGFLKLHTHLGMLGGPYTKANPLIARFGSERHAMMPLAQALFSQQVHQIYFSFWRRDNVLSIASKNLSCRST
jgi:hypothetical protein